MLNDAAMQKEDTYSSKNYCSLEEENISEQIKKFIFH